MNVAELAELAVAEHGADQKPWELAELGRLVLAHGADQLLEIGTFYGGTAWFWHKLGLQVTTIDIDQSRAERVPGVGYIESTSDAAAKLIDGCDALFVDGDHGYAGVHADWLCYRPKLRPGGLAAFHDIEWDAPQHGCEVPRFWQDQIKGNSARTVEIVDPHTDRGVRWAGIGVVFP